MLEQRAFRDILGHFATGVVLITAQTPKGPVGLAVNSFTSVSLDPPLVALCVAHTSTTWPAIRASGGFAVTILGERQAELCHTFSVRAADRFPVKTGRSATPAIPSRTMGWLGWTVGSPRSTQREIMTW